MRNHVRSTRLRLERTSRHETLQKLSDRTGISVGRLSMIERGLAKPSGAEQETLSRAYEMSSAELFPEPGKPGRS